MQLEDIKKLAELSRLDLSDEEMIEIAADFEPILAYVSQVQEVTGLGETEASYLVENVLREDVATNPEGSYHDVMIAAMPDSQDGFLKVKQIL